ncbi:hypothetical protein WEH80_27200 [Actinomycetes bacterium KLBMP 9759]
MKPMSREYRRDVRRGAAVVAAMIVLVLPACSQPVQGTPDSAPRPAATPAPVTTTAPPAVDLELLVASLLRPTEVGPTWKAAGAQPKPDANAAAVCGGPGVVAQFPNAERTAAALESEQGELLQETLSVYPSEADAYAAFNATSAGLACREGKLGETPVTLTAAADVQPRVGGDRATLWTMSSDRFSTVLVSVLAKQHVVNFAFITPAGVDQTIADPIALSRTGVARLLATY